MKDKLLSYMLFIYAACLQACNMGNNVEKLLYKKYQEEFELVEDHYNFIELGYHQYTAYPTRFPAVKVQGEYSGEHIGDNYPETLRAWQSEQFVKSVYQKEHPQNYVNCAFTAFMQHQYGTKILEMNEVLQMDTVEIQIENYVYLFDDINAENKEKMLNEVLTLINHYNQYPNKEIYIKLFFWDKSFLVDKNFDSLNFTLNVELFNNQNDDNDYNKIKYIKHLLPIEFKTPSKTKFSIDTLFSAVIPYDTTTLGGGEAIRFE